MNNRNDNVFDICQWIGLEIIFGVVVRDLIVERWQTIFPIQAPYEITIILEQFCILVLNYIC
jgi:hypothetical protein